MVPRSEDERRAVRFALRLGVLMLAGGAQAQEVERSLRSALEALGLEGADAVVMYPTVMVSHVAPGDAEATTAIQAVRRWQPDLNRLAAAAELLGDVREGRTDLRGAESELELIAASSPPYPSWLRFAAPTLVSVPVTVMFGGRVVDAALTFAIGLAIQPALARIARSDLSSFFQVVFGVFSTSLLVVLLVKVGVPIHGGLVLTGSLLRFLPGPPLVAGMRDFIDGALTSGAVRLVEVVLLGAAVAGAASLALAIGTGLDVHLGITVSGRADWPAGVIVAAGGVAVAFYACSLGVPRRALLPAALLGALAVLVARGLTPATADLTMQARILVAALLVGAAGGYLGHRGQAPSAVWTVPAILPLLPAPATLIPLLADSDSARQALEGQAATTAFSIGVGVAAGAILVESLLRYRGRLRNPVHGGVTRTWRRRSGTEEAT